MHNNIKDAWIALDQMPNIGPKTTDKLMGLFGSPVAVLTLTSREINGLGFLNKQQIASLLKGPDWQEVERINDVLDKTGTRVLLKDDQEYPANLKMIPDAPTVLYIKGKLEGIEPAVAIVGTRAPSQYGVKTAFNLARNLSLNGIPVVSGLARGIDTQAHLGALGGIAKTVAVLGSGIDNIYPAENEKLAGQISLTGAVITEFAPGTKPEAHNFPRRNRIIAALSQAVIVVEATIKSGAMITARLASDLGKTIMAVPGLITNVRSQGPHSLIRNGALLVESADDVILEIAPHIKNVLSEKSVKEIDEIVELVSSEPLTIEQISSFLNIDIACVSKRLTMLELKGSIKRTAGNRFGI